MATRQCSCVRRPIGFIVLAVAASVAVAKPVYKTVTAPQGALGIFRSSHSTSLAQLASVLSSKYLSS